MTSLILREGYYNINLVIVNEIVTQLWSLIYAVKLIGAKIFAITQ